MTARINPSDRQVASTLILKSRNTASSSIFCLKLCSVTGLCVFYTQSARPNKETFITLFNYLLGIFNYWSTQSWQSVGTVISLWLQMVTHHRSYQSNLGNMAINGIRTPKSLPYFVVLISA